MKHSIHDKLPFYHPEAVEFLDSIIKPYWKILETGAGSSTIWLASKAKKVITYEHSPLWFNKVADLLIAKGIENVAIILNVGYPKYGISG